MESIPTMAEFAGKEGGVQLVAWCDNSEASNVLIFCVECESFERCQHKPVCSAVISSTDVAN
jgi:hypothetical protein